MLHSLRQPLGLLHVFFSFLFPTLRLPDFVQTIISIGDLTIIGLDSRRAYLKMTSKKSPIFRVTGLPAEPSDEELDITLRNTIDKELSDEEAQQGFTTTVIPSCYDDLERAALVEFHGGAPKFLHVPVANPLESWQVEMGNTDINFDQNFFGFTQLYTPKANAPVTAEYVSFC